MSSRAASASAAASGVQFCGCLCAQGPAGREELAPLFVASLATRAYFCLIAAPGSCAWLTKRKRLGVLLCLAALEVEIRVLDPNPSGYGMLGKSPHLSALAALALTRCELLNQKLATPSLADAKGTLSLASISPEF